MKMNISSQSFTTSTQSNSKRDNEFLILPIQVLALNKNMPLGYKFEKLSVLKRYEEKKKTEIPLKKPKLSSDGLPIKEKRNKIHSIKSKLPVPKSNLHVIKEKEEYEVLEGLKVHMSNYNLQRNIPSPDSIKFSPVDITFSPFAGSNTLEVVISPLEFNSPRGKAIAINAGIPIPDPDISEKKVRNFADLKTTPLKINSNKSKFSSNKKPDSEKVEMSKIIKELKEMKDKYNKLEKELESVKKRKPALTTVARARNTRKRREVTDNEKMALGNDIEKLSLEDKKEMRVVIKDYIKILSGGEFQFNINSLPREKFDELRKYVDKCLNPGRKVTVKTKKDEKKENVDDKQNKEEKLQKENNNILFSPKGSTVESDDYVPSVNNQIFIKTKRNRLIFDSSAVSSSLDSSSFESLSSGSDSERKDLNKPNGISRVFNAGYNN